MGELCTPFWVHTIMMCSDHEVTPPRNAFVENTFCYDSMGVEGLARWGCVRGGVLNYARTIVAALYDLGRLNNPEIENPWL